MQQLNVLIDTVSSMKSNVLKTIVTDETLRKPMQNMIDAETQLSKAIVTYFGNCMSKCKVN